MSKFLIYGVFAIIIFFMACNKDEDNIVAEKENNWFEIPDRPGEFGQLIYGIYKDAGVSIFVNDTLGSTYKGKDAYGQPVYEYERITEKFYIYGNRKEIRFTLSQDTAAMILAVKAIKNWVIPNLPAKLSEQRIKSILLTDSLLWSEYGGDTLNRKDAKTAWVSNISVETLPVGRLFDIKQMDFKTLKFWAGMILSARPTEWIMENCPDEMVMWQDTTNVDRTNRGLKFFGQGGSGFTGWYGYNIVTQEPEDGPGSKWYQDSWSYNKKGFLEWVDNLKTVETSDPERVMIYFKAPTLTIDIMNYVALVYAYSEAEFKEMFAGVEGEKKITAKRKMMLELLKKFETKFEVTRHPFTPFE